MNHHHFILYKPDGYLSQFVSQQTKRKNKKMLGELYVFPEGTMAIGRLDEQSEGVLLLTTDGKLSEFIRSNSVEKEYYAQVDGIIDSEAIEKMKSGIEISSNSGRYLTRPCSVNLLDGIPALPLRSKKIRDERHGPTSWISIILTEGKFRQVRKMTAAVGFPTLRLVRTRIGNITIEKRQPGDVQCVPKFSLL